MTFNNGEENMTLPNLELKPEEEFRAVKQAAENGNISAMEKLAEFYEKGIGTPVDSKAADYWRNKAKE